MIYQLIQKKSFMMPDAIAVSDSQQQITYRELDACSNQLAYYLQEKGVTKGTLVGIGLTRSIGMVVSVLATLKAGGAYVPLDPDYPKERIQYMSTDSNLSLLLTEQNLAKKFGFFFREKIFIDSEFEKINSFPADPLSDIATADDLAYVLYTSGSTGKPKGVMIAHKSLVSAYKDWENIYHLTKEDCHLQMASFSFDVFAGDWIRALGSGAKLVLCPREVLLDPAKLYDLMSQARINCAEFVPSVLRKLMSYLQSSQHTLDQMRLLVCGSDNWSIHEYQMAKKLCGTNTRIINSYGATEATIDSTYFELDTVDDPMFEENRTVPLGKPFPHTKIFLLDEYSKPVKPGEVGEIHIVGEGLAKGYLNREDLTAQKFVMLNLEKKTYLRAYKTGDQGRVLSDGNIEYLGRIDSQVKIRGMRIELSDIENVLNSCPIIKESLVAVNEEGLQEKFLVAYVVLKNENKFDIPCVRNFLLEKLPAYMIPAFFMQLKTLPLTPNGKLDRRALMNHSIAKRDRASVPPRNEIESSILLIWQKCLCQKDISVLDNFFEIGGHSLMLAGLITELEFIFGVRLDLPEKSTCLTIERLANQIQSFSFDNYRVMST